LIYTYESDVVVAIVRKDAHYLVFQNAMKGLLANLWDFPHIIVDDDIQSYKQRQELINQHVSKTESLETSKSRKDIGTCQHLFTHIKRLMYVELIELDGCIDEKSGEGYKWVSETYMLEELAVPATLKKAFALLSQKSKKRKIPIEAKQPSILSYFKKK
jgi:A/G-specific adenine glycosylase